LKKLSALLVVAAVFLAGVLLLPASRVPAVENTGEMGKMSMGTGRETMDMGKMISSAKTRADHEALAAEFEKEAAESKA
jgi:hypothetical protein